MPDVAPAHARPAARRRRRTAKERRQANARTQRLRAHQRAGEIVVDVVINNDSIAMLLDLQWLDESVSEDRREIGSAIGRLLADAAAHHRGPVDA